MILRKNPSERVLSCRYAPFCYAERRMLARASLLLCIFMVLRPAAAAEKVLNFGNYKENETPSGFRSIVSGSGKPGEWKVLLDDAPSLFAPLSPKAPATSKRAVLA